MSAELTAPPATRRFTLRHGMFLILAIAVGLAMNRSGWPKFLSRQSSSGLYSFWLIQLEMNGFRLALPFLWSLSAVVVLSTLLVPKPEQFHLFRSAGVIGCVISLGMTTLIAVTQYIFMACKFYAYGRYPGIHADFWVQYWEDMRDGSAADIDIVPGAMIAGGWIVLAFIGQWRTERNWIDRLGRRIGLVWLLFSGISMTRCWWHDMVSNLMGE